VSVRMCACDEESGCVWVIRCVGEIKSESVRVRKRERVCAQESACACVCERESESARARKRERVRARESVRAYV